MKKNLSPLSLATSLVITTLLFSACSGSKLNSSTEQNQSTQEQGASAPKDTLSYQLGKVKAEISTSQAPFGFDSVQLSAMSSSCGSNQQPEYFQDLVKQFNSVNAQRSVYSFKYQGTTQGNGTYEVFLLPNVPGYKNLEDFEKDFTFCGSAAKATPALMNEDWLFFTGSCRKIGIDEDSNVPNGCLEVKKEVDPTFKLK